MNNKLQLFTLFILFVSGLSAQTGIPEKEGFIIGADLSMTKAILDNGGVYKVNDEVVDVFEAFKQRKYNYARLRLFHTPDGNESTGTVNSLEYTLELAKTIKASGLKLLLDFHYSDTWADPSQQSKPQAWEGQGLVELNNSIYNYTKEVMNSFAEENVYPDMVQTGNEINHGMLWDDGAIWVDGQPNWLNFTSLLKSAIKGVRDSDGGQDIPIMIHAFDSDNAQQCQTFMENLNLYNVQFDVMGLSYYVCWNGSTDKLDSTLSFLNSNYNKKIMLVETNYNWDGTPDDNCELSEEELPFPYTEQGQYDYLQEIYNILTKYPDAMGLFYWGGDYIWAEDIGGSWSSLFHWQGNDMKAFDAFFDLLPVDETPLNMENKFNIYKNRENQIVVRKSNTSGKDYKIVVLDLLGKQIYSTILEQTETSIKLNTYKKGLYLVGVYHRGTMIYSQKILY